MGHFLPFYPTIYPKNKIWKKCKNTPGDIILLHICGINEDHMMYGSCNTRHGKQNFLSFWAIFLHLTHQTTKKINIFKKKKKKKKKIVERLSFYTCVPQMMIIWCMVPETWNTKYNFFCHFQLFFFTPKQPGKSKFWKNGEKKGQRHHHFSYVYHEWQSYDVWFLKYEARQTELFSPSFYASVPKIKIICYTASEIWCVRDVIIIFQFGPFFSL